MTLNAIIANFQTFKIVDLLDIIIIAFLIYQLLGIGNNGHIAFNEPCEEFPEKTHVVDLTQNTIEANARFFESMDQVPKKALTMGIGTIMKAKKIVLLANGPKKAQTIYDTVYGPITPKVPASVLRLHPDVTIFVDEEAGALLKK